MRAAAAAASVWEKIHKVIVKTAARIFVVKRAVGQRCATGCTVLFVPVVKKAASISPDGVQPGLSRNRLDAARSVENTAAHLGIK